MSRGQVDGDDMDRHDDMGDWTDDMDRHDDMGDDMDRHSGRHGQGAVTTDDMDRHSGGQVDDMDTRLRGPNRYVASPDPGVGIQGRRIASGA